MTNLLHAANVRKEFGGLIAVNDIDFTIPAGSIVSLIGPNGAGKTTFFNMIAGLYRPSSGEITFRGRRLNDVRPDQITSLGIARTFQNIRLFGNMSALDNVLVGMHARLKATALGAVLRLPSVVREEREARERALEWAVDTLAEAHPRFETVAQQVHASNDMFRSARDHHRAAQRDREWWDR